MCKTSWEQKAVVWLRVVYFLLLDQNQCCFLLNKSKEEMCCFALLAYRFLRAKYVTYKPNESVYIGNLKSSTPTGLLWYTNMSSVILRFIVSEVKMPCSCSPKAKAFQSRVRKQNNCPSFGNKSTSSRIPREEVSFVSIYKGSKLQGPYKIWTADCGLRTDWV